MMEPTGSYVLLVSLQDLFPLQIRKKLCENTVGAGQSSDGTHTHTDRVEASATTCVAYPCTDSVAFIVDELDIYAARVFRHRFGCRILQRLQEHCPWTPRVPLVTEVVGQGDVCPTHRELHEGSASSNMKACAVCGVTRARDTPRGMTRKGHDR